MILGDVFDAEGDAVIGGKSVSGLDGFAIAGDEAEDAAAVDDEDVEGIPVGLFPATGEFGAVVADIFATQVIFDAEVQLLLRLEGLIEEGSGVLCAQEVGTEEKDGGAGRNRTDE